MVTIVTHKIISVTFYQTVNFSEDFIKGRKAFNTIDNVLLEGVKLSRVGESIVIEHDKFTKSYCIGMANVRHYSFEKEDEPVELLNEDPLSIVTVNDGSEDATEKQTQAITELLSEDQEEADEKCTQEKKKNS